MASLTELHPDFVPWVQWILDVGEYLNLHPRLTSTYRSIEKQTQLYERYLRGEHPLPVAPPGRSLHNYGLAADLVSDNNALLGRIWRQYGGVWGPSDPVHFSPFATVDALRAR